MQEEDRKRRQDSLKMLNEMYLNGTDDEKELARNTLVGIDTSRQNAEMARMLQLQLNADSNRISTLSAEVANRGRMLDVTSTSLAMFANPELQTYMNKQLGEAVTGDLFMQNIQRFAELAGTPIPQGTPIRGPETPSTMDRITDLLFGGQREIAPAPTPGAVGEQVSPELNRSLQESLGRELQ
jgi:hypothetical protein